MSFSKKKFGHQILWKKNKLTWKMQKMTLQFSRRNLVKLRLKKKKNQIFVSCEHNFLALANTPFPIKFKWSVPKEETPNFLIFNWLPRFIDFYSYINHNVILLSNFFLNDKWICNTSTYFPWIRWSVVTKTIK